jgi:hypothetical protein
LPGLGEHRNCFTLVVNGDQSFVDAEEDATSDMRYLKMRIQAAYVGVKADNCTSTSNLRVGRGCVPEHEKKQSKKA